MKTRFLVMFTIFLSVFGFFFGCGDDDDDVDVSDENGLDETPTVNINRWKNVVLVSTYEGNFYEVAFSPDGSLLALYDCDWDNHSLAVTVLRIPTLEVVMEIEKGFFSRGSGRAPKTTVIFLPNQQLLVADVLNGIKVNEWESMVEVAIYTIYEIPTGEEIERVELDYWVQIAIEHNGQTVLLGSRKVGPDGFPEGLIAFTMEGNVFIDIPDFSSFAVNPIYWLSQGGKYFVVPGEYDAKIWEAPGKLIHSYIEEDGPESFTVTFDGKYIAATYDLRGTDLVILRDANTLEEKFRRKINHVDGLCGISFSPDGKLLAVPCENDDLIKILSVPDGTIVSTIAHDEVVLCLFSADGNYLITSEYSGDSVMVWKPE